MFVLCQTSQKAFAGGYVSRDAHRQSYIEPNARKAIITAAAPRLLPNMSSIVAPPHDWKAHPNRPCLPAARACSRAFPLLDLDGHVIARSHRPLEATSNEQIGTPARA